ncbi:MAG: translation elongation factor Ts [Spirochaetae bacterium HGW-Spirochaetae-7]|nr:MAG: translation elongation factor Ts [Spirochaetae bacterium HGW-Spirochaetae-7]
MEVKVSDIKALREKTGAGMMDCKKALVETECDVEAAEAKLKEWGLAGVKKRFDRATNEGRIFIAESSKAIALVEIDCETDFVCRNDDFIKGGQNIAKIALDKHISKPVAELEDIVRDMASVIKENITLKRVALVESSSGEYVHSYLHGEGRLGVVVKVRSDAPGAFDNAEIAGLVHDLALHIAAFKPLFVDQSCISADWVKEQQELFKQQVDEDEKVRGKPANVIEGILAGKLKKRMTEISLADQGFVKDEKQSVKSVIDAVSKATGIPLSVVDFVYSKIGED